MRPPSRLGLSGLYCIPKAPERTRRVEPSQANLSASLGLEYLYRRPKVLTSSPHS